MQGIPASVGILSTGDCHHAMTPCLAALSAHKFIVPVQTVLLHVHRLRLEHMAGYARGLP